MNIRLEQYKVFYIAAKHGSFSEAAKNLYITQSAVSQQIRALEEELGATLFVRGKKGAKLTSHGELLYSYAKRAIEEFDNAENLFSRMKSLDEGTIRIGAGDTITRHYLLNRISVFHDRYPGIKIEIVNRVTDETLSQLYSGKVDISFVSLPIDTNKYNGITIRKAEALHDLFIAGNKYRDLQGKVLSMKQISDLPLVMLEPKSNTRKTTDFFFAKHGIKLNPEFELGSHDLLFDFAKMNLGIACVTKEFGQDINNAEIFELTTDFSLPERNIGICTLDSVSPTPAVTKLIEMIDNEKEAL